MAVTVTENAAKQIRHSLSRFGGVALRLGVKKVGCNGWAYTFDIAKEVDAAAHVFEGHENVAGTHGQDAAGKSCQSGQERLLGPFERHDDRGQLNDQYQQDDD